MKLRLFLQGIVFFTIIIISSQLLLLFFLTRDPHLYQSDHYSIKALKIIDELAVKNGFNLLLLDEDVLLSLLTTLFPVNLESHCQILCNKDIIHLGVKWSEVNKKLNVFDDLAADKIKMAQFMSSAPGVLSNTYQNLTSHIIFSYESKFIVDVALLYECEDNMAYVGSILKDDQFEDKLSNVGLQIDQVIPHEYLVPNLSYTFFNLDGINLLVPKNVSVMQRHLAKPYFDCNNTLVQEFRRQYDRGKTPQEIRFRHKAWKVLSLAKQIFNQVNIPFWLSSGTCLGYYRQCDIIPYTTDVDIGVFAHDYTLELIPAFLSQGFRLKHVFGRTNDSFELSFILNGVKLDVFFFYEEAGHIYNGGTQARTGKKYKYIFHKFDLCWTYFLELVVNVPCPVEKYLQDNYGEDWFTPVVHWDWKTSPANVVENGYWNGSEWSEVIRVYDL